MQAARIHSGQFNRATFVKKVNVASKTRIVRAAAAPETGHHTVPDALRDEALAAFFEGRCETAPTTGGVNNVCQYVTAPDGARYVLRIYNNGGKSEKVAFEHEVLAQLGKQNLSFQVPKTRPALKTGAPYVKLSSGDDCCVFEIIPGRLAKTAAPREVGRATGELCSAMAAIGMGGREAEAPVPPYFDAFKVHHAMDRGLFYELVAPTNAAFDVCREAIDYLVDEIRKIEPKLEAYKRAGFPMQIIHGDLHYDNVLVQTSSGRAASASETAAGLASSSSDSDGEETVVGLLDFEFVAYDWRVMELAVALSKYFDQDDPLPLIREFVAGYALHGDLTDAELEALPDLINLRMFSNVIYFVGRAHSGEDDLKSLTSRAGSYARRVKWINANRAALVGAAKEFMRAARPAVVAA